ncbi:MAG: 50S ribosomal protein L17 [Chloroflexi bacterium]|nr:50S ribosomal protein L17 [Chloroflexota bacterium]|tara:strand:- start:2590 stop:2940 length:351 start_codon:yes stop_codon:yes gene_type:complete
MRHRVNGRTLGRRTEHRESMLYNLVSQLIKHERLTTTEAKAREVKAIAEKIISKGRDQDLHSRRQTLAVLPDKDSVEKLFDEIGPRYADRPGGYTRMVKLMPRKGDAAPMALLELV